MTDHTGMVEHAVFVVPNYPEGYTTDDNARALIVTTLLEISESAYPWARQTWLPGTWPSYGMLFDPITKRFRNCLSYECQWQEPEGRKTVMGGPYGVGNRSRQIQERGLRGAAGRMFELAVPASRGIKALAPALSRCWTAGISRSFPGDRAALSASMRWQIDC